MAENQYPAELKLIFFVQTGETSLNVSQIDRVDCVTFRKFSKRENYELVGPP